MTPGGGASARASSTSKPSASGIHTSRKSRSGLWARTAASAARPSAHSPTTSISASASNNARSRCRANGSSSTISTRIGNALLRSLGYVLGLNFLQRLCRSLVLLSEGQGDRHEDAALWVVAERQGLGGPVQLLQACSRIADAYSFPVIRRKTAAIV